MTNKNKEKLNKAYELVLKDLKKGYGRKRCKRFVWGCYNCFGQLLIDMLEEEMRLRKDNKKLQNKI
jgi:hypothetical protein